MEKLFLLSHWCRPAAPPDFQFIDEQMVLICPAVTSFLAVASTASETHTHTHGAAWLSLYKGLQQLHITRATVWCYFPAGLVSQRTRLMALLDWRSAISIANSAETSFGSTQTSLYKLKCSCAESYLRVMTRQPFLSFYYSHLTVWHLWQ